MEDGIFLPLSPLAFNASSTLWCSSIQDSITPGLPKPRHSKVRVLDGKKNLLLGQQQFALELGSLFPEGVRGVAGVCVCVHYKAQVHLSALLGYDCKCLS